MHFGGLASGLTRTAGWGWVGEKGVVKSNAKAKARNVQPRTGCFQQPPGIGLPLVRARWGGTGLQGIGPRIPQRVRTNKRKAANTPLVSQAAPDRPAAPEAKTQQHEKNERITQTATPAAIEQIKRKSKRNLYNINVGWPSIVEPPADQNVTQGATTTIVTNTSDPQSLVIAYPDPSILGPTEEYVISATPPISQGRRNFTPYLRYIDDETLTGNYDEYGAWTTIMSLMPHPQPLLIAGTRIGIAFRIHNYGNGADSQAYLTSSVTT